ncbi:PURINE PERMEASE 9-RELATED [Salix koriyanagi]|uniref:Probable purine permease n=1 Tax=Salix koriyanagi TaxID=2511006 RepID=A0A9Q0Q785_9ROSI|nr:PURINE PERMEASE 9-RELATED [Salix koriyanagi]
MLCHSRPFSVFPCSSQLLTGSGRKIRIPFTLAKSLVIIFMEGAEGIELQITDDAEANSRNDASSIDNKTQPPKLTHYKWWLRVTCYILFLLSGQSAATLLGRVYYDKGGNSKWMATFVQSAGFPILLPLLLFFPSSINSNTATNPISASFANKPEAPRLSTLTFLYVGFGALLTGDNLMYSYGLLYLPVSTYSLLCATQLAFNALFSFFLNSQKLSPFVLNSITLLTASASLLAVNADSENPAGISRRKYVIGFLCTLGASATYSLYLSLVQLSFEKVIRKETFSAVLKMQIYPSFVATCGCVVGLFASTEWESLEDEMRGYKEGKVSYLMTLIWTAITWQISSVGLLGLIFEVSSLFSNVISTLALPLVPILAVVFLHDKMNGVKVMAMLLAIWGFLSYIYQHYLDDAKSKTVLTSENEVTGAQ